MNGMSRIFYTYYSFFNKLELQKRRNTIQVKEKAKKRENKEETQHLLNV